MHTNEYYVRNSARPPTRLYFLMNLAPGKCAPTIGKEISDDPSPEGYLSPRKSYMCNVNYTLSEGTRFHCYFIVRCQCAGYTSRALRCSFWVMAPCSDPRTRLFVRAPTLLLIHNISLIKLSEPKERKYPRVIIRRLLNV